MSGISNIDLRKKVGRKIKKEKDVVYKKREDHSFLKGRTYNDYNIYMNETPYMSVLQMDTVYNDVSSGPYILEDIIGRDLFIKYASVCLTDRGSEFSDAEGFEKMINASRRTRIFYCNPMQSGQKGELENSHK